MAAKKSIKVSAELADRVHKVATKVAKAKGQTEDEIIERIVRNGVGRIETLTDFNAKGKAKKAKSKAKKTATKKASKKTAQKASSKKATKKTAKKAKASGTKKAKRKKPNLRAPRKPNGVHTPASPA